MNKWRKTHSGTKGEEMTAAQLADYKKIKAELRGARLEIDFRNKAAAFLCGGSPGEEHDMLTPLRQGRQPPWNLCDVPLSGWCRIQGCYTLARQGVCWKPAKRRRGTRYFCDVFLQRLRTNPPVIDGSAKSWNAGGVATSPEGRCAGSCSLEGLVACQPRPKAHNYRACCRPGRAPRPDRKELHG